MFRRVVVSGGNESSKRVKYVVSGARPISQYRSINGKYSVVGANSMQNVIVFNDAVLLSISSSLTSPYFFDLDVSENQPVAESVEIQAGTGLAIAVYNEHGVLVCSNGVIPNGTASEPAISVPGEMTNVPGTESGEMTSVPGEEPGEMAGETTDEPGAMI